MKHCLVVDDSAVIRKVARRILEGLLLRTSEAEDGEAALLACGAEMPDAVLVDACMPGMEGSDFIRQLRARSGGDHPRIVFCTVDNDVAQIARARHAGADVVMLKPFNKPIVAAKFGEIGML